MSNLYTLYSPYSTNFYSPCLCLRSNLTQFMWPPYQFSYLTPAHCISVLPIFEKLWSFLDNMMYDLEGNVNSQIWLLMYIASLHPLSYSNPIHSNSLTLSTFEELHFNILLIWLLTYLFDFAWKVTARSHLTADIECPYPLSFLTPIHCNSLSPIFEELQSFWG